MDTISKINLEIMDLENSIERCIDDNTLEFIPDYQEQIDYLTNKLKKLESSDRRKKTNKKMGVDWLF